MSEKITTEARRNDVKAGVPKVSNPKIAPPKPQPPTQTKGK